MNIGPWELLLIFLVVLLLFGARRLPEVGKSLGQAFREFKNAMKQGLSENSEEPTSEVKSEKRKARNEGNEKA
ncbi:MAG: twin-arginine translocase TatA/TatE family subunit [Candidatus Edwardsbacteria bacterium]